MIEAPRGDWAASILGLFAADLAPRGMWLDGGRTCRGFFGAWPDLVIEGDEPGLLDDVESRWRRSPEHVWIGWLTYDWGADLVRERRPVSRSIPGLGFRRFPAALEFGPGAPARVHGDPQESRRLLAALGRSMPVPAPAWPWGPLRARVPAETYRRRVEQAQASIVAGETYQINLAQPFEAGWRTQPGPAAVCGAYGLLRSMSDASMGGFFSVEDRWVLSNSPETLLAVDPLPSGLHRARSWPIKGTAARQSRPQDDVLARRRLEASSKDAAEHVMIVDLVRNDLGMLARPGTVEAASAPTMVSLATVHHWVTEVCALTDPGVTLREWVGAMFPGGSITGAPKRRTIEIIEGLEDSPRGLYCGSLVLLAPDGIRMSITIRTALVDHRGLVVHGGGGVVVDSEPEGERLETIAKVRAFAGRVH